MVIAFINANVKKQKMPMEDNRDFQITPDTDQQSSYIKVIGVGGAGTNVVNYMYKKGIVGVDFIVCNTDKQSLDMSPVATKVKLGDRELGAGNDPTVGQQAAIAAADKIKAVLDNNTHMLFIAAGMGGGTGTGAAPEIAKIAKEIEVDGGTDEILVVAVVTTPFGFEGRKRREQAKIGVENLKKIVDSIIVINTDKLRGRGNMSMLNAFNMANDVLFTAAKGIAEIITANNAYIHVDFKDVQSVMSHSGVALMGSGIGEGEERAYKAIEAAATSDLLNDDNLADTKNILLYVTYASDEKYHLQMEELDTMTNYINEITGNNDVDLIWGWGFDDTLEDKIAVTLVATGFEDKEIYHDLERYPNKSMLSSISTKTESAKVEVLNVSPTPEIVSQKPSVNTQTKSFVSDVQPKPTTSPATQNATEKTDVLDITLTQVKEPTPQPAPKTQTVKINLGEDFTPQQNNSYNTNPISHTDVEDKQAILDKFAATEKEPDYTIKDDEYTVMSKTSMSDLFAVSKDDFDSPTPYTKKTENTAQTTQHMTLRDTLNTSNVQQNRANIVENTENKQKRIERIRELLKSGKVDEVQKIHPTDENFDEQLSAMANKDSRMELSRDGVMVITENPIIGSGVD